LRTWEHLDPDVDGITAAQDQREEWTHANGVAELPNGDLVVSFRQISTVIIIERKTMKSFGSSVRLLWLASMCRRRLPTATSCSLITARIA
jgi:hypothetical protein